VDGIWVALHIFEQFCPKARNADSLIAEPEPVLTQNGHLAYLIYFGVIEEPPKGTT